MGLSRDKRHKRRATGGRRAIHIKKRKYEMARPPSMTKIGAKRVKVVRVRGGNYKYRAMRLEMGNFSWGSEAIAKKTKILDVSYNASNNELVRTKTLVKNTIVQVDAVPFREWYKQHYGAVLGKKKNEAESKDEKSVSEATKKKQASRRKFMGVVESQIEDQFRQGRLYACISSRPGQSGRADGYILEGEELQFYLKKMSAKKKK
mmetsp:Transcript_1775/g.2565  ORF Transcript_1775/g.2565 Transcript_1775/m.2565 type:complete len:205 (-) Transcript_1775:181-795(-)|eukprot:CAMPEP_0185264068 /NCGR_PEP_ID=MMETSP1359-20130426/17877_1 /TAXON_ID=552665 /ORGANISM="Bigelowiella longifila, Strain CCMP242" /LENGTH=204 /DNA_ID=CAMNT_0027852097 /DNA_START=36 /DNA_END=650 /DNA_ORIENTATION=+